MSQSNYCILPAQADEAAYRSAMRDEIATWGKMDLDALSKTPINHPLLLAYKAKVLGGKAKTSNYSDWTDFLLGEFGPRTSCFSLGAGMGRIEEYLINSGFCTGFNSVELAGDAVRSSRERAPDLKSVTGDLNFLELPRNSYDFILCHGVMHHLINVEHVMDQVNDALTDNGIFLLYEYIGEDRWQFEASTIEFLRKEFPGETIEAPERWRVGGFESIRSADICGIFEETFQGSIVRKVQYGGAYFPYITCAKSPSDESIQRVVALDEATSKSAHPAACYMMAIARKSVRTAPRATPWDVNEIHSRLMPPVPALEKIARWARKTPIAPVIRRVKRLVA